MATEIDRMRDRLVTAYNGYSWHEKVAGWPPEQVIAVFKRFERDGWPNVGSVIDPDLKPEEPPEEDEPDDNQMELF